MTANQVQNDAAINVARRFAPGNLKVSQINLPHLDTSSLASRAQLE